MSTSDGPTFTTVDADGKVMLINGTAARIIQWIIDHQSRVNGAVKGEIVLNFAPGSVVGRLSEVLDQQQRPAVGQP